MKSHFVKQIRSNTLQEVRIMNSHILERHHSKARDNVVNSSITDSVELFAAMAVLISIIGLVFFAVA